MHSLLVNISSAKCLCHPLACSHSPPVTIWRLPDQALLKIFRYYLDANPRSWATLVHICRKWRRIVFASQQVLQLRLFCTDGTPILKNLDCWPAALPIVVEYGGSPMLNPPAPGDEDNIIAALKQSGRVSSLSLTITSSLLERFSAAEGPFSEFSELGELVLMSRDSVRLTLPSVFRWGPRLRQLHLTRVTFSALPHLLYSSRNLECLQLHDVLDDWHILPDALAHALSGMSQLRSLSLHLLSTDHYTGLLPTPWERVVLPTLTHFDFQGTSQYLDDLAARIDAHRLEDFGITLYEQPMASQLSKFVDRIMHKSYSRADIQFSGPAVCISFIQPASTATCLKLRVCCQSLDLQLFCVAQICSRSAFISGVEDLRISFASASKRSDRFNDSGFLKLIGPFKGVKWLHVAGNLSVLIIHVLHLSEMRQETVLPAMHKLFVRKHGQCYAPLREAVESLLVFRRLSSSRLEVEYERPLIYDAGTTNAECQRYALTCSERATIETLSGDVLLQVFRHFLDVSPPLWPTLMHVCQRWKEIVLASSLGLHLRLFCTYGTPVLKTLHCWPPFPLVLNYGGSPMLDPPTPEDEDNIMAALTLSDRVSSIRLSATSSLLAKFSAIQEPFSELEELVLLSQENVQLALPSTFRWGPRLRILRSTRVAFPSLPQLLSPSNGLVELQLDELPSDGYFSPEAFVNALSGMTQLRTLSLHFRSLPSRRNYLCLPPPPEERVVLPALAFLKYRGTSKYLDCLVARIDAPRLGDIDITFFNQPTMDASQLGQFVDRIEMHESLHRADILTSQRDVSIFFSPQGHHSTRLVLRISSERLDWQLSSLAQICTHFSPFLLRVEDIGICTTRPSSWQGDVDGERWVELIRPFGSAKDLRVAGELATAVLRALGSAGGEHAIMLPALRNLHLSGIHWMDVLLQEAVKSFSNSRRLSNIRLYPPPTLVPGPNLHPSTGVLSVDRIETHEPRNVCPYCFDFQWSPNRRREFLTHIQTQHPETTHPVARVSGSA